MDRDRYSGNCLFKVEADNGEGEEEEEEWEKVLCGETMNLPLFSQLACMLREALKMIISNR